MEVANHPAVSSRSFCAGSSFCAAPSPSFEYALVLVSRSTTLNLSICYKQTKQKIIQGSWERLLLQNIRLLQNTFMNLNYATMKQQQHMANVLRASISTYTTPKYNRETISHDSVFLCVSDNVTVSERECKHTLISVNYQLYFFMFYSLSMKIRVCITQ